MIFNQDKLYKNVIGVFFAGKTIQAARIENGAVAQIIEKEINNHETEEHILNELIESIKTVFNKSVSGIGIGVPSIVDVKNGIVYNATHVPSWRKVYLKDIIEERFNTPTYVNNDANCFAIGEKYFGTAKDFQNIAGITIGAGLGVGIIINGRLYSGKNCGAGEFCSIPYRDHDYEYYCSSNYFEEKYGIKSNVLFARAKKNDKIALAIYEQFGLDLGNAIKTIIYAIDPEAIIIGGQLSEAYEFFQEAMFKNIKTFLYKNTINDIVILKSEEPNIETFGAAALCFEDESRPLK